eukprot:6195903-Pleurochrysis_carterae.AAC.2
MTRCTERGQLNAYPCVPADGRALGVRDGIAALPSVAAAAGVHAHGRAAARHRLGARRALDAEAHARHRRVLVRAAVRALLARECRERRAGVDNQVELALRRADTHLRRKVAQRVQVALQPPPIAAQLPASLVRC